MPNITTNHAITYTNTINSINTQKKLIIAHKTLVRNRKIIWPTDKNKFKEA